MFKLKKQLSKLIVDHDADQEENRKRALIKYLISKKIEVTNKSEMRTDQLKEMLESISEANLDEAENKALRLERINRLDEFSKKIQKMKILL